MRRRQSAIAFIAALMFASTAPGPFACAQDSGAETPVQVPVGQTPSPFLLEPEAQIRGDNIKSQTYNSQPAGENKNWNLDIGRFQPPVNEDPNRLADDLEGSYSGMRLRLPFRGRTEQ